MRGNTVSIKGNCTRDLETRRTQSGNNACSWGMAWNSRRKNPQTGDYEDVPHYFDVECWASDGQLKFLDGVKKGARCAIIDGHLEYQSWQRDGQTRPKVIIRVDDPVAGLMVAQGGNVGQGQVSQPLNQKAQQHDDMPPTSVYDDDIPF